MLIGNELSRHSLGISAEGWEEKEFIFADVPGKREGRGEFGSVAQPGLELANREKTPAAAKPWRAESGYRPGDVAFNHRAK